MFETICFILIWLLWMKFIHRVICKLYQKYEYFSYCLGLFEVMFKLNNHKKAKMHKTSGCINQRRLKKSFVEIVVIKLHVILNFDYIGNEKCKSAFRILDAPTISWKRQLNMAIQKIKKK